MRIKEKDVLKYTDEFFSQFEPKEAPEEAVPAAPRDLYTEYQDVFRKQRPMPHGARAKVSLDAEVSLKGMKAQYEAAKHQSEMLEARGEKGLAKMVREQYMQEKFLPAVEALILTNSVDDIMNATNILDLLDSYAMTDAGKAKGFTRSFIRSLYGEEIGLTSPNSDSVVREGVDTIKGLVYSGNIRAAIGKATKMLERIDSGEQIASNEDYELIQKVAMRGQ